MTFIPILTFDKRGYSEIMYSHDMKKRYRIIKNPSKWIQFYYFTFVDTSNQISVKLYPWDR
jgi:hypothetical protein